MAKHAGSTPSWSLKHTFPLFLIVVAIPLVEWFAIARGSPLWAWFATMLLLIAFLAIVGHGVVGMWRGVLVDDMNTISLSRLQMAIWTVIVISGFFTGAIWNVYMELEEPLAIALPSELWLLLGISTTSLVGAPLILGGKQQRVDKRTGKEAAEADEGERVTLALLETQGDDPNKIKVRGSVIVNEDPKMARWSDLFTGDGKLDAAHVQLARVQMFLFTVVITLTYGIAIGRLFADVDTGGFAGFPTVDESMVALLGISHTGYLVQKQVT